jgi:hypothetical protein
MSFFNDLIRTNERDQPIEAVKAVIDKSSGDFYENRCTEGDICGRKARSHDPGSGCPVNQAGF